MSKKDYLQELDERNFLNSQGVEWNQTEEVFTEESRDKRERYWLDKVFKEIENRGSIYEKCL